jgi:hypothetical protein
MDNTDASLLKAKRLRAEYLKLYRVNNKEKINQYQRDYRANNKDKVKQYNTNYWIKKANLIQD